MSASIPPLDVDVSRLGRPIRGPSAFGADPRRMLNLTRIIAVTDFKLKFFGSVLGYFWQLARPLLLFGVLYLVFNRVLKIGVRVPFYPAVLITNIVLFTFFTEVTGAAVSALVDREGLLRKVQFPRLVVPLAVTLTAAFNLGLNLIAVCVFLAIAGVSLHVTQLEAPFILLAYAAFAAGAAMLLSALYPRFRDIKPIWEVLLQALYFGTPIIYTIEAVQSHHFAVHIIMSNPISVMLIQFRHAVIDPSAPSAAAAAGGWGWLAIPFAIFLGVLVVGLWFFNREAPRIAEEL